MTIALIRRVSWVQSYRNTMTWMRENMPGSLLFAPVVFPLVFVLKVREQYLIGKFIESLTKLNQALVKMNQELAKTEAKK